MYAILLTFQGRIGRQVYWLSSIGVILVLVLLELLLIILGVNFRDNLVIKLFSQALSAFMVLFGVVTYFAIQIKRWHDRDKSGWWMFIHLLPYIGSIWTLIELGFLKGTDGPNRFGADPLQEYDT